jgi:hypothetical protein
LSKDLNLTHEKVIQAMGRIGRNNIQQTYTVRFRDDTQILKLFTSATDKPEIRNMNRLFNSRKTEEEDQDRSMTFEYGLVPSSPSSTTTTTGSTESTEYAVDSESEIDNQTALLDC